MDKRYQVFVSSTYADLREERQGVTLHGKVDAPEEASLPWGVQDVQKDEKEKSKTIHG